MNLRCQWKGTKCPSYTHEGTFEATNETLLRFEHDLKWCAQCTASAQPALPSFQDDLLQIARITLWRKGPLFDPNHTQQASFRTYILSQICGTLTNAKKREVKQSQRFTSAFSTDSSLQKVPETKADRQDNFVETLIWEMWHADFEQALPQLLKSLTKREQQVFTFIRANMKQCTIAETLGLSKARVSQLLKQVERKLTRECQHFGIIE